MQIDLHTLWYLTIGTLLVSAALLLWERQAYPRRARELALLAGSLFVFALGCVVALNRHRWPGIGASALTNIVMVSGYLLVLHAAAGLDRRMDARWSVAALCSLALLWAVVGAHFPAAFWNHVAALPIALVSGLTAWTLLKSRTVRDLRSRRIAAAISGVHAVFYLARAAVSPILVQIHGEAVLPVVAKATMFEAVLYAVAMPMTFLALVRDEVRGQLVALSQTDHLTGAANRHGFFEAGERVLAACGRDGRISLLAFDLDHFKAINDRHGHMVGDEVLKLFAAVARDAVGPRAILVRLGGEEFAALLPGRGCQDARQVGLSIAQRFTAEAARADGLALGATVSIGLAVGGAHQDTLADLLARADRALYQAKFRGRNRLEVAEPADCAVAA